MSALAPPRIVDVPACSRYSASDYDDSRAAQFDPRDPASLRDYTPSTIGGFVLGSLCGVAAIYLAAWLIRAHVKRRSWKHQLQSVGADARQQTRRLNGAGSIEMNGINVSTALNVQMGSSLRGLPRGAKPQSKWAADVDDSSSDSEADGPMGTAELGMSACASLALALVAIAATAMCVWAAVAGGTSTNGGARAFWRVIDAAQAHVNTIQSTLKSLVADTGTLRDAFQTAHDRVDAGNATLPKGIPSNTTNLLQQCATQLTPIIKSGEDSISRVQTYGVQTLQSFEHQFRGATQRTQRFGLRIVFPVCYSIFAAFCIPLAAMAAVGTRPRLTGWLTVLMWLLAGFLLLYGAGVLHGSTTVTKDSCLYSEALVFSEAQRTTAPMQPQLQRQLLGGLKYYFGLIPTPVHRVAAVFYGVDFEAVQQILDQSQIQKVTAEMAQDAGAALLGADASGNGTAKGEALRKALPAAISNVPVQLNSLVNQINVAMVRNLHQAAKEALCCKWSDNAATLFAAWTSAGVFSLLLCAVVTVRLHGLLIPGRRGSLLSRLRHTCC